MSLHFGIHHIQKLREQKGIVDGRNNFGSDLNKIKNLLNSKFKMVMSYLSGEKGFLLGHHFSRNPRGMQRMCPVRDDAMVRTDQVMAELVK